MARTRVERGTFLELLAEDVHDELLKRGSRRGFSRGDQLMHQGEPGDRVLILLQGHVKATFVDTGGHEVVLSFRGPGDVLGELSFSRAHPRSSGVVAIEPVEAQALAASEFRRFLQRHPDAALALIEVISQRFRDANRKRVQFGALDTTGRVASRLLELCERYGDSTADGIEITLPITQEDLGGWSASSRAGVAEALRTMRELGWIKTQRRRITVLDPDALQHRVEPGRGSAA